jgi:hypothetical protein
MAAGVDQGVEIPSKFKSALEKLQRIFGGALWDAKLNSCFAAWSDIRHAKSAKKKIGIFNQGAQEWIEGSVKAIREWLPKFAGLAEAYPEAIEGDTLEWAKERVWEVVEGQCGLRRPKPGDRVWPADLISRTMVFWFAVASEGNSSVNVPPLRPWKAPRWPAPDGKETRSLLRERSSALWLRLNFVIDEELDLAQVQKVIGSRDAALRQKQTQRTAAWSADQLEGLSKNAERSVYKGDLRGPGRLLDRI